MIYLGADHAGFKLKEEMKKFLEKKKIKFTDLSPELIAEDDYPDIAKKVARAAVKNKAKGLLVCGSGIGVSIAANKVKGARAGVPYSVKSARLAVEHNNVNVLCLAGREMKPAEAKRYFDAWHKARFSKEARHHRRVKKMM